MKFAVPTFMFFVSLQYLVKCQCLKSNNWKKTSVTTNFKKFTTGN